MFGLNGTLRLDLRDPASPGTVACIQLLVPESARAAFFFSQIGSCASVVRNVGPPHRSMARSARFANGVNEVVTHRSPTTVQGRFWLQGIDPMGFVMWRCFRRITSCLKVIRSNYQADNKSSNSNTAAAPSRHFGSSGDRARAQRNCCSIGNTCKYGSPHTKSY